MSNNDVQIQIRVYDYGKQGVLDAEDKISLQFQNEFGQTVGSTKAMSLDEFKENSVKEFQKAFPGLRPEKFASRLFFQPYLPDEFSDALARFATQDQGYVDRLEGIQTNSEFGLDPTPIARGVQVYVGWHTKADSKQPLALHDRDFYGVEKIDSAGWIEVEPLKDGYKSVTFVNLIEDSKKVPGGTLYVRDTHVLGKELERKVTFVTPVDDDAKGENGRLYVWDSYGFDPKKNALIGPVDRSFKTSYRNENQREITISKFLASNPVDILVLQNREYFDRIFETIPKDEIFEAQPLREAVTEILVDGCRQDAKPTTGAPAEVPFGNTKINTSNHRFFMIRNSSACPVDVRVLTPIGFSSSLSHIHIRDFDSRNFHVEFRPIREQSYSGTLDILPTGSSVRVSGRGVKRY